MDFSFCIDRLYNSIKNQEIMDMTSVNSMLKSMGMNWLIENAELVKN